ncbi:hypothetical protein MY4824_002481 [Beauveria thailandica]
MPWVDEVTEITCMALIFGQATFWRSRDRAAPAIGQPACALSRPTVASQQSPAIAPRSYVCQFPTSILGYACAKTPYTTILSLILLHVFPSLDTPLGQLRRQTTAKMISDNDLYTLAIFLGSAAMLLIIVYHFLEVNSTKKPAAGAKAKST